MVSPETSTASKAADQQLSPFTLYSSDNPGALITSVQLTGENYNEWASEMFNALQAKRKTGFINGTLLKPAEGDSNYENWIVVNSMILGWLRSSIVPKIRSTVAYVTDSCQLWKELKERFSVANTVRIHQVKAELASCRQEGQSVLEYYGRLSTLWDELQIFQPLIKCSCGANSEFAKQREQEKIHQFVLGLDDSRFGGLSTSIISTDPLPSLGEIYSKVIREEQRLAASRSHEHKDAVGLVAKKETVQPSVALMRSDSPSAGRGRDRTVSCSHCGKSGHDKERCWQIIGYPDWMTEKDGRGERGERSSRGRGGRTSSGRGRGRVSTAHATSSNESNFPDFTPQQWQALTKLLEDKAPAQNRLSGKKVYGDVILDTGASHHMTGDITLLSNLQDTSPCSIGFADGRQTMSFHTGVLSLSDTIVLSNVLYVPHLNCTLFSVSKLLKQTNCFAVFSDTLCILQDRSTRILIGAGEERDGVYYFTDVMAARINKATVFQDSVLWHQRLGHPAFSLLSFLPMSFNNKTLSACSKSCDICFRAKQTREVFFDSSNKIKECFSLIHCDVWGPYRVASTVGAVYFLTIVDDYSRAVYTFLMRAKSEVSNLLRDFIAYTTRQFHKEVKTVRSDNGTEFLCLSDFFREKGIVHQTSCVSTPQQNGRVERKHRHILNVARALLFQAHLPIRFWGEAILTASYVINRTPSSLHHGKSPYEILYGEAPAYTQLRVFGCECYVHLAARDKDKFGQRSRRCVFIGYPIGKKGWKVFDIERDEILISRDVVFHENVFPFSSQTVSVPLNTTQVDEVLAVPVSCDDNVDVVTAPITNPDLTSTPTPAQASSPSNPEPPILASPTPTPSSPRRSSRQRAPSVRLQDYVTYTSTVTKNPHHVTSGSTSPSSTVPGTSLYPLSHFISDDRFSSRHQAFLTNLVSSTEPRHFKDAAQSEVWRDAMSKEITALEVNNTWELVDLPPHKTAIGCQWVFKIKYNADGSVERYKARLVVQGNKQTEGVDYTDTFAPVVKMTTVRTLLRLAAARQWPVFQMDVHNAFLHGDLAEEVYMKLPPGFRHTHPTKVCRLKKSLYGLKQAPRCWFQKLSDSLLTYGFVQSYDDYSLFSFSTNGVELRVLIYVDDLLICGNDLDRLSSFKAYLSKCFAMKDLGHLKYFLGIEVSRGPDGFYLTQRKYALDIISDTGFLGSKPVATPIETNHHLALDDGPLMEDPTSYRRLIGRLIYLTHTRPELCYSVHVLSQFMQQPREAHWSAALRVVRFLKGSPGQGILLHSNSDLSLSVYCDSDWASCPLTRRSLSAFVVLLGGSPISWKTKKQQTVSHSSAEAEYRAMSVALREVKWLRSLLVGLGVPQDTPTNLFCDSKAAIHIAANPVFHERTKHIENDCHAVRDAVRDGIISTQHVRTNEQLADVLTKSLGREQFESILSKLGVRNLHAPT